MRKGRHLKTCQRFEPMIRMTTIRGAITSGLLVACLLGCAGQSLPKESVGPASWLLSYETNRTGPTHKVLQEDARFRILLRSNLPQQALFLPGHRIIGEAIGDFIGDEPVILKHRYVTIDGCVHHMCPELQGFLWIDAQSQHPQVIFAALTTIPPEEIKTDSVS